jgi:deazaflavin-dependent oxidoreductase (nitroreductase family)
MKMHPLLQATIRGFSRLHTSLFRTFGATGPGAFRHTLILTTRGRKTGRETSTPLLYIEESGKLYLVASFGGNDAPPGWYLNLSTNPEVKVETGQGSRSYRARSLTAEEAGKVWPQLLELYPPYASYQKRTTRVIPVVELTPVAD